MIGLDYVMAGYFHLAAGQIKCELKKTPQITVSASDTSVKVDHSKSQKQLDAFQIDTVSPYGANIQSHVGGLMSGEIRTSSNMRIMQETYPAMNAGCLMVDRITVKIHIDPTIYIANHYKKTGCMYKAIMDHEKKHVNADRMIVNKYTNLIIKALDATMKRAGYAQGPFTIQAMPKAQQAIMDMGNSVVKEYSQKMNEERRVIQQNIDSLAEYNRVNNLCRGRE